MIRRFHAAIDKMAPYRVNDCFEYAITEMVWYHSGGAVPLMFASTLLKGVIIDPPIYQEYHNLILLLHEWNLNIFCLKFQ